MVTKLSKIGVMYSKQKTRSKRRGHPAPTYSKDELVAWLFSQPAFHSIYNAWEQSNYDKMLSPSIDRIDSSLGYSLDNIRLMTWAENKQNGHDDMRKGNIAHGNNPQKAVIQYSKTMDFIAEFISVNEAGRTLGIDPTSISSCCNGGRYKSAGGYKWKFKT